MMIGVVIVLKMMIKGSKIYDIFLKIKIIIFNNISVINEKIKLFLLINFIYCDLVNFKKFFFIFFLFLFNYRFIII